MRWLRRDVYPATRRRRDLQPHVSAAAAPKYRTQGRRAGAGVLNDRWRTQVYRSSDDLLRSDLRPAAKIVGMRLAVLSLKYVYPDAYWRGSPNRQSLAESCGLSERAVTYALRDLERAGLLGVKRGSGRQHSTYRLARGGANLAPQGRTKPTPSPINFAISDRVDEINAGELGGDLRSIRDLPETEER